MPTRRTLTVVIVSALLYFFANQTQVGWLYIMSALMIGLLPAAWWFGRGMLRRVQGERKLDLAIEIFEGDSVHIDLALKNTGRRAVYQLRTSEHCPLVEPDHPQRTINVFIPTIPTNNGVLFGYDVLVERRGLHTFPPLNLQTSAPFGFFRRQRSLDLPTRVLVYPEVRPISRLSLLDQQQALLAARPRGGLGSEVIGSRPYRLGDSPRHLNWRSIARTGQLISKEFADESQPGVTLALDVFAHPYANTERRHRPFEWAVKIGATIAEYARRRSFPLQLRVDQEALPAPGGALAWDALLQYLARVQPTGKRPFADMLQPHGLDTLIAAILPYPDTAAVDALIALKQRGYSVLAVMIDPASFPDGGASARSLAADLSGAGVETRTIRYGMDWTVQLVSQEETEHA
jgi:uncharacterized protein (DUF58 family)